jgi:Tfp pilus assembly protein PilF
MSGRVAELVVVLALLLPACNHTEGVKRKPELSHTHYLIGEDLVRKKQPDGARRELLKSIELDPENREAHELLGMIFFLEGVHKMNLLEQEQCLRGVAAEEQHREANKEFRRAEEYLRIAVKLGEKEKRVESDVLNTLGNIALHFKRYDDAIAYCQKALDNILYTQRQFALGTLGWAYHQKGDRQSAARELRQAIFQEPKFCVGRYRLAKVYFDDKALDKAIEELKKVVEDAACPIQEAHQLLGLCLMKRGETEAARVQFEKCQRMNPKSCVSQECQRYSKLM